MNAGEIERVKSVGWLGAYDFYDGFVLYRRNEDGIRQTWKYDNYPYYFFIREEDLYKSKPLFSHFNQAGISVSGKIESPWVRVYCKNTRSKTDNPLNTVLGSLKSNGIPTFEADIPNWQRFCIEHDIRVDVNQKIAYLDIETDDSRGPINIGQDRIVSVGIIDDKDARWFFCDNNEETILRETRDLLVNYDLIVTYNGDRFDIPYLKARFELYGIQWLPRTVVHLDAYERLARTVFRVGAAGGMETRSWRLDDVGYAVVGKRKVKHDESIWELFNSNRELLREYNLVDVELLKGIVETLKLIDTMQLTSSVCGRFLTGVTRVGSILDMYILKNANARNIHYPTITLKKWESATKRGGNDSSIREGVVGGFVKDASIGLHENVHVYDYSAMYPHIIMAWNIGPDTYIKNPGQEDITSINGHGYRREPGIFATSITRLLEERKRFQTQIRGLVPGSREALNATTVQTILKELGNSMYGIFGYQEGRYFQREIAESITLAGQFLLKESIKHFEENHGQVLFADTDSCAVIYSQNVDPVAIKEDLESKLPKILSERFNIDRSSFSIKYEKLYSRLIIVKKKHYSGWIVTEDGVPSNRLFVRGLDYVRRDTAPAAREAQLEVLNLVLRSNSPIESLKDEAIGIVYKWRNRILDGDLTTEDIVIHQSVTQETSQYRSVNLPIHVKIGEEYKQDGKELFVGQDVQYIVTSTKPRLNGVPYYKYDSKIHRWDRMYYWNHRIYSAIKRILEIVYPEHPWSIYELQSEDSAVLIQGVLL